MLLVPSNLWISLKSSGNSVCPWRTTTLEQAREMFLPLIPASVTFQDKTAAVSLLCSGLTASTL
jgi:hypothetical protein